MTPPDPVRDLRRLLFATVVPVLIGCAGAGLVWWLRRLAEAHPPLMVQLVLWLMVLGLVLGIGFLALLGIKVQRPPDGTVSPGWLRAHEEREGRR